MSVHQQFEAAVNVIKGLPKNGPYQPSNEMMLKFYGFFKQATEGRCYLAKPGIWNVVSRAKWEAWNKLGDMSEEEAMRHYVDELKKIIETMSFSDDVADFMQSVGPFYETVNFAEEDDHVKAIQNSPEMADSGIEVDATISTLTGQYEEPKNADLMIKANHIEAKMDQMSADLDQAVQTIEQNQTEDEEEEVSSDEDIFEDPIEDPDDPVTLAIKQTVHQMKCDMENVTKRLSTLEKLIANGGSKRRNYWPCAELSTSTTAFIITWPFIAYALLKASRRL